MNSDRLEKLRELALSHARPTMDATELLDIYEEIKNLQETLRICRQQRDEFCAEIKTLKKALASGDGCECCVSYECDCLKGVTW